MFENLVVVVVVVVVVDLKRRPETASFPNLSQP
jgi:hypothetical protein